MVRSSLRCLLVIAVLATSAVAATTARADGGLSALTAGLIGGNCGATSSVFAPWGDGRQYYFTADGGFEGGGVGWTFAGGAKVVQGNEPSHVHSSSDHMSLSIPNGATATSPSLCFGLLTPGIKMFASGPGTLHVQVIAHGLLGGLSVLDGGTVAVGPGWNPTTDFGTLLGQLNAPVGTKSIQIQLTATGNVQIDDIYIDPFLSR